MQDKKETRAPTITPFTTSSSTAIMRQSPEDFRVDEIPAFEPEGEGEHLWLSIRKRGANTDWVAGQLARLLGVRRQDIGYAGLKDRQAVTTQWFSAYLPGKHCPDLQSELPDDLAAVITVLKQTRHVKKLRRGTLQGNQFHITLRDFSGDRQALEENINRLVKRGFPNYFGMQRFGSQGRNISRATDWFEGRQKPKNRQQRSLYLSSARSLIFNEILARRVTDNSWDRPLPGDVFILDGTHSWFLDKGDNVSIGIELAERVKQFDIHPSGALWGKGALASEQEVATLETSVADDFPLFCNGLQRYGLKQERRALRVPVPDLAFQWQDEKTLVLDFPLPAGAYATVLIEHLCTFYMESQV